MTILIADANSAFAQELQRQLDTMEGMDVVAVASDGEEAAELLRVHQPEALVLDLMLSKRDGLGVLKLSQELRCPPAVLVTTSYASEFVLNAVARLGVPYVMLKPCDLTALVERLEEIRADRLSSRPRLRICRPEMTREELVTEALHACRIPTHLKGFDYLYRGILLALEDPQRVHWITKRIYPQVAKELGLKVGQVERNMRSAIENAWSNGGKAALEQFLGYGLPEALGKPSNSEFIAMVSEKLRARQKNGTTAQS